MLLKLNNNKNINVEIIGEGFPIIFVHSYLWDSNMWEPQIKEFSKKYKCILIDLWGHGNSDSLEKLPLYSLEYLTWDIIEVTQKLNINKFIYIGLSVGAMIGAHLGIKYGDHLSKLILMDGYSGEEPHIIKEKYFNMLNIIEKDQMISKEMTDIIVPMFFSKKENSEKGFLYNKFELELLNKESKNINTIVALGKGIFGRQDILSLFSTITIPTLFLVGEEDIPRPPHESIAMSKLIKNSKIVIVPKSGHISNLENSKFVNKEILKFIEISS